MMLPRRFFNSPMAAVMFKLSPLLENRASTTGDRKINPNRAVRTLNTDLDLVANAGHAHRLIRLFERDELRVAGTAQLLPHLTKRTDRDAVLLTNPDLPVGDDGVGRHRENGLEGRDRKIDVGPGPGASEDPGRARPGDGPGCKGIVSPYVCTHLMVQPM